MLLWILMVPCKTSTIKLKHIYIKDSLQCHWQLFFRARARARLVILTDEIKQHRTRDGYYVRELYPGAYKCSNSLYIAVNCATVDSCKALQVERFPFMRSEDLPRSRKFILRTFVAGTPAEITGRPSHKTRLYFKAETCPFLKFSFDENYAIIFRIVRIIHIASCVT